jgi:uncharacterized membrane protein HdeD (DUF308 family)
MKKYYRWRWWAVALRGVVAVLFGIAALFAPGHAYMTLVVLFGAFAIVNGVFELEVASRDVPGGRGPMIAEGIVSIVAGFVVLLWPVHSAFALLVVIAAWAIVTGILEIAAAIRLRKVISHEWVLALEGIISVAFGVLLLMSPLAGAVVLGLWVGAYALVFGGLLIGSGLRLRGYTHTHPALPAAA